MSELDGRQHRTRSKERQLMHPHARLPRLRLDSRALSNDDTVSDARNANCSNESKYTNTKSSYNVCRPNQELPLRYSQK